MRRWRLYAALGVTFFVCVVNQRPGLRGGRMKIGRATTLWTAAISATFAAAVMTTVSGQSPTTPVPSSPRQTAPRPIASSPAASPAPVASVEKQQALINQYCVTCHSDRLKTANLSLQGRDLSTVGDHAEFWEKVVRKLRAGVMPPPDLPRPALAEYEGLRDWLEAEIDRKAAGRVNPGSVVLHRLNRTEYANAIRDLLDLEIDVTTLLPPDDLARGFDNIAGSLTISPTLLESYATAAARVARMSVGYWKTPTEATYLARGDTSQNHHLEGLPFGTRGGMMVRHDFPADGEYKFAIQNFGIGSFIPGEQLELVIDGERAHLFKYQGIGLSQGMAGDAGDGILEVTVPVKAGSRVVGATFLQTNLRPSLDMIKQYDRKSLENNSIPQLQYYPAIGFLRVSGPFHPERPDDSRSRKRIFTCRPPSHASAPSGTSAGLRRDAPAGAGASSIASEETPAAAKAPAGSRRSSQQVQASEDGCARQILTTLTRRAYRRPASARDVNVLMDFFREGRRDGTFDEGIELALRRLLASPQFLVRAEHEPATARVGEPYRISDLELASRLSFFLWSSIPDDELIAVARQGRLSTPRVLEQQVRRMLADGRSSALVNNFAQQLLYLRNLPATSPDGVYYPDWDDELRTAFQRETELFFETIFREDRSVLDLLNADYTFVNERLARHYGIPNIYGSHFRRVTLGPELDYRRGILGKGSFLSVTWTQNFRTSPVKRGVWVLENLLGTPPPEPPPNVPALEETAAAAKKILTLREQMTMHRASPTCAGCHKIMDPIGFALDNFDADGKWRTKQGGEGGVPIDASVALYDGQKVVGPVGLRQWLLRYSPQFVAMFTEKMMTYALGRGVEYPDMPVIRSIVREASKDNNRFSAVVMAIVKSPQFQMRVKEASPAVTSTN
jgi:mono/diheme cytochrome c family protein